MKLLSPKTAGSRPILDRVKESLFSVLVKYDLPEGKIVADVFSGVGSLGLESLSRGAEFVSFVEKDPGVVAVLNRNIEKAGFVKQSKVIKADAFRLGVAVVRRKYDLIFVDPPYAATKDVGDDSPLSGLMALLTPQLVASGIVVVRTHKATNLLERYGSLEVIERRKWASMAITILGEAGK